VQFHHYLLFDPQEMDHLGEHSPEGRRVVVLNGLMHPMQPRAKTVAFWSLVKPIGLFTSVTRSLWPPGFLGMLFRRSQNGSNSSTFLRGGRPAGQIAGG
jgi:hypothetical protein